MPNVSLNAFLKIISKNTPQKAAEYGRYLTPGGYDFYWRLKEAARERTVGGKTFTESAEIILESTRDVERKHNLSAFKKLDKWLHKEGASEFFEAPVTACSSPANHIAIKLEPEFGYVSKGQ